MAAIVSLSIYEDAQKKDELAYAHLTTRVIQMERECEAATKALLEHEKDQGRALSRFAPRVIAVEKSTREVNNSGQKGRIEDLERWRFTA